MKIDVDRFVNVSTDKAADPTSVLGASKLAAEKLTALAAAETGRPYVSVRFGNVLGSQGSVLPTFPFSTSWKRASRSRSPTPR